MSAAAPVRTSRQPVRPGAAASGRRASATARKAAAAPRSAGATTRRSSASATRRRSQVTPIGGFVPVAVGRTAGAVGAVADSGAVVKLTKGRLWIPTLAVLLVGIVALNVGALGLNAASSKVAGQADGLNRHNTALRARIATELSSERVQTEAARLGLIVPAPGEARFVEPRAGDAEAAAERLASGELGPAPVTATAPAPVTPVPEEATVVPAGAPVTEPAVPVAETAAP